MGNMWPGMNSEDNPTADNRKRQPKTESGRLERGGREKERERERKREKERERGKESLEESH